MRFTATVALLLAALFIQTTKARWMPKDDSSAYNKLQQALTQADDEQGRENDFNKIMPESGEEDDAFSKSLYEIQGTGLNRDEGDSAEPSFQEPGIRKIRWKRAAKQRSKRVKRHKRGKSKEKRKPSRERGRKRSKERKGSKERKRSHEKRKKSKEKKGKKSKEKSRSGERTTPEETTTSDEPTTTPSEDPTTTSTTTTTTEPPLATVSDAFPSEEMTPEPFEYSEEFTEFPLYEEDSERFNPRFSRIARARAFYTYY